MLDCILVLPVHFKLKDVIEPTKLKLENREYDAPYVSSTEKPSDYEITLCHGILTLNTAIFH